MLHPLSPHDKFSLVVVFQYKATDFIVPGAGKLEMVYTPADGAEPIKYTVHDFSGAGVALGMFNTDEVRLVAGIWMKCHVVVVRIFLFLFTNVQLLIALPRGGGGGSGGWCGRGVPMGLWYGEALPRLSTPCPFKYYFCVKIGTLSCSSSKNTPRSSLQDVIIQNV